MAYRARRSAAPRPARGTSISGNNNVGIRIQGAAATGNVVRGNYIGSNAAGGAAVGNTNSGITIQTSATGNTIGGTAAGEGNLISGNTGTGITVQSSANGNTIQGNLIGLNAAGAQALGNGTDGIRLNAVSDTIIGGTTAAARNVISGNTTGIQLQTGATGTLIQGNRIGTNAAGTVAVPNGAGINVSSASGNTIGGTVAGAGNQISGNTGNGIWINAADNNVVQGNRIGVGANGLVIPAERFRRVRHGREQRHRRHRSVRGQHDFRQHQHRRQRGDRRDRDADPGQPHRCGRQPALARCQTAATGCSWTARARPSVERPAPTT